MIPILLVQIILDNFNIECFSSNIRLKDANITVEM